MLLPDLLDIYENENGKKEVISPGVLIFISFGVVFFESAFTLAYKTIFIFKTVSDEKSFNCGVIFI